jgi:hypothetical protein
LIKTPAANSLVGRTGPPGDKEIDAKVVYTITAG